MVSIPILREYLAAEFAPCLQPGRLPFTPSLERLIDDIVFLCFFVGNGTYIAGCCAMILVLFCPVVILPPLSRISQTTVFSVSHFPLLTDFLPHLPSLDIRDGALDFLFNVYKRLLPSLGDYITNHGGNVNLSHVDVILANVSKALL